MAVDVVVGLQRGDEGKGRFVDSLAQSGDYDIVARFNGGNNAGHTVVLDDGRVLKLHMVPSGITNPDIMNVIGNGALVNPLSMQSELGEIAGLDINVTPDNLMISSSAHMILPHHVSLDEIREAGALRQGTTKTGIAPVAADKAMRIGARMELINNDPDRILDLVYDGLVAQREARQKVGLASIDERETAYEFLAAAQRLGPFITDTALYLNRRLNGSKPARILAEGAQAFLLDLDHGGYPSTTSSITTSAGAVVGLGIPPQKINQVFGVAKAVQSHVGGGHFVTEVTDPNLLAQLHGDMTTVDAERGTTTGRTRRLGYLDLPLLRRANMINGTTEMFLTKLDWVPRFGDSMPVCVAYERKGKRLEVAPDAQYKLEESTPVREELPIWDEDIQDVRRLRDLPDEANDLLKFIMHHTGMTITRVGVGPHPDQVITEF